MTTIIHIIDKEQTLILGFIEEDLKLFRIRRGLEGLGFYADDFHSNLPDMVFDLLGYHDTDQDRAFELYFDFQEQLDQSRLTDKRYLKSMTKEVYGSLVNNLLV